MKRLHAIMFACLCSPLVTSIVIAANTAPPQPSLRKTPPAWMGFGLMFLFFGVVIAINLKTSKRGHQE